MAIGTLRDQVIYPDSADDMAQKGLSDDVLQQIMDKVWMFSVMCNGLTVSPNVSPMPFMFDIAHTHVCICLYLHTPDRNVWMHTFATHCTPHICMQYMLTCAMHI